MEQKDKDIELYKASLTAFFQNELEHDKIILGLSTAGIGFFIAIFQQDKVVSEIMYIASIIALSMFAFTVLIILGIFIFNKKQLISIIANSGKSDEIKELTLLDKTKYIPFGIAILCSVIFTLSLIFQSIKYEEKNMSKDNKVVSQSIYTQDGFSSISQANQKPVHEGFSEVSTANQQTGQKGFSEVSTANQGGGNTSTQPKNDGK